jgi:hypothetical protein
MSTDKTDQKRDRETGDWVSDLKPGAGREAKADKAVEDTFPASDPANMNSGTTGFIAPGGKDLGKATDQGSGEAGTRSGGKP